jgi:HKD family nuclease
MYTQPLAHLFGNALQECIRSGIWKTLEVAVAWVRRSGMQYLNADLANFLRAGGSTKFTIGIDIENTSWEGLQDLLALEKSGNSETFIYHNEDDSATFHPKVYLFKAKSKARLIIGSNNLTQAGLFSNTEAGLQIDASRSEAVIREAEQTLAALRADPDGFVKRLDDSLLKQLVDQGYVMTERALQRRRSGVQRASKGGRKPGQTRLFPRKRTPVPRPPGQPAPATATPEPPIGQVLLMRVRRQSETDRRTQINLPIRRLKLQAFFGDATEMRNRQNQVRRITYTYAGESQTPNTIRVNLSEIDDMQEPVLRLERTSDGIVYEAHGANTPLGRPIMAALQEGLTQVPPTTLLTVPGDRARSTWVRAI